MNYYPDFSELQNKIDVTDKNTVLLEVRKSWRSILSSMIFFIIAAVAVILLNVFFPHTNLVGFFAGGILSKSFYISLRWLGVIPAIMFAEILRRYHNDLYTFSLHNLTHYEGRLSLNYTVPNIRYVDIRAVVVYQDIWGRLLDYGDLELDTAAQEKSEMYIKGVRDPEGLAELIEGFRQKSLSLEESQDIGGRLNQD